MPELNCNLPDTHFVRRFTDLWQTRAGGHPEFKHAAAVTILSIVADRRVQMDLTFGTIYPNAWSLILGESSSSGKSTTLEKVESMTGKRFFPLPKTFSREGFVQALADHPRAYYSNGEIGGLLAGMHRTNSYLAGMSEDLCAYYDCPASTPRRLAGKKKEEAEIVISDMYISFLGATTPQNFESHVQPGDLEGGLLARFLIYRPQAAPEYVAVGNATGNKTLSDELDALNAQFGEICETVKRFNTLWFTFSANAFDAYNAWQREFFKNNAEESAYDRIVNGRMRAYAFKLAALYYIGDTGFVPDARAAMTQSAKERPHGATFDENGEVLSCFGATLEVPDVFFFEALANVREYFIPVAAALYQATLQANSASEISQLVHTLEKAPGKALSRSALLQNLPRSIKARELETLMTILEDEGRVEVYEEKSTDRLGRVKSKTLYRLIENRDTD
ncbi:MAG: YfjI family protein [Bacteroidales bacterium]|nr:YfjI family protein [Bacteroidales bacterium]